MIHYTNILILRTNLYSKTWSDILHSLNKDILTIIVLDEKNNDIEYCDIKTLTFSENTVRNLRLKYSPDMQWRFGDYCLYIANDYLFQMGISYDFIWMVEPDVLLTEDVSNFISHFASDDSDFISTYLEEATSDWMWYKYKSDLNYENIYRTFFPLIRISSCALDMLYNHRVSNPTLANDEVFVATVLMNNNCKALCFDSSVNVSYDRNSFSYMLPHYGPLINFYRRKSTLYHPVFYRFPQYISHLKGRGSWRNVAKRIFRMDNKD